MTYSNLTDWGGGGVEWQGLVKPTEHFTSSTSCRVLDTISPLPHLLLLQKGPVVLVLDDLSIWHLRHRRRGQWDISALRRRMCWPLLHSQKVNADLYVAAVSYYYILLRDQARQSLLRDDVLNLTCDKEVNEEKYRGNVFVDSCRGHQNVMTSSGWLLPQSPGCLLSSGAELSVHPRWLSAGCMCLPPVHIVKYVVIQANVCRRNQRADCVKLKQCTWSDRVCSWATMMCSCPRACSRSGRIVAWCACRAVSHTHPQINSDHHLFICIFFPIFCCCAVSSLHCSVARASSSLLTMMVCWDVAVRLFRVGWSWLWRRSMWNFRWPFRLNLRYQAGGKIQTTCKLTLAHCLKAV